MALPEAFVDWQRQSNPFCALGEQSAADIQTILAAACTKRLGKTAPILLATLDEQVCMLLQGIPRAGQRFLLVCRWLQMTSLDCLTLSSSLSWLQCCISSTATLLQQVARGCSRRWPILWSQETIRHACLLL